MATSELISKNTHMMEQEAWLRGLAREIAMDILPRNQILENRGITQTQWGSIASNHAFVEMLTSEVTVWNSALNTRERVELKAQAMLEDMLLAAHQMVFNPNETATARVEMVKTIAKIAGIGDKGQAAGVGEKVSITINMGNKELKLERDVTPTVIEGSAVEL